MIGPFPLLSHLTFCVGTKALGVVRMEGELSELARTNVGVETALHVLTPPERESRSRNRVEMVLCWLGSEGVRLGQRPVFQCWVSSVDWWL